MDDIFLNLQEDDIFWVLTVPAIWDDEARQFMRKAAFLVSIHFLMDCNYCPNIVVFNQSNKFSM